MVEFFDSDGDVMGEDEIEGVGAITSGKVPQYAFKASVYYQKFSFR